MPLIKKSSKQKKDANQSTENAANTLLANIRFMSVDNPVRTMVITSSVPNEGKTYVSRQLARSIAASSETVLLVECDMRRRSAASNLGVHAKKGLHSVVSGRTPLKEAVVATQTENLFFLDAEPHIPNPSDLLNSRRFTQFIEDAKQEFDYVIFDTPPVVTFVDAAVLGSKVDAVFVVVRENFARKQEVAAAAEQLAKAGCNVAGVIMNYCERRGSEYYYEYYYRKYHDDKEAPRLNLSDELELAENAEAQAAKLEENASSKPAKTAVPQRPNRATKAATSTKDTQSSENSHQENSGSTTRKSVTSKRKASKKA